MAVQALITRHPNFADAPAVATFTPEAWLAEFVAADGTYHYLFPGAVWIGKPMAPENPQCEALLQALDGSLRVEVVALMKARLDAMQEAA